MKSRFSATLALSFAELTTRAVAEGARLTWSHEDGSEDDDIRCFILTGAEGNFSSGMDLRAMAGDEDSEGAIDTAARPPSAVMNLC